MFVSEEVQLEIGFTDARARLATLTHSGWLLSASRDAHDAEAAGLAQIAQPGSACGQRVAGAAIRAFLGHIAQAVSVPARAAD